MNYKKLNLKIGIEVHRQLNTGKLFCRCPSLLTEDKPDFTFKRKLRPVISELGEIDKTALYESTKKKYGIYEGHYKNSCEVELDESPVYDINMDALNTMIQVSKMLNASTINTIEIMRKQVLDYSNTTGFQRTALISTNGNIKTEDNNIKIDTIILEEDAARKTKETKESISFKLDRLGIPLIEIATAPDIKTPEEAKEIAEHLGMVLKSTGKFRSGLGTIRQDLNLSIKNGSRVELKGVQDLKNIPKIIDIEIERQLSILKEGKEVEEGVRRIDKDLTSTYLRPLPGKSRIYSETDHPLISITDEHIKKIKIPELISDLSLALEKKYKLSKELAKEIIKENKKEFFETLTNKLKNLTPGIIAHTIIDTPKEIESKFNITTEKLNENVFYKILEALNNEKISKNSVIEILVDYINTEKLDLSKYKTVNTKDLEKEIKDLIQKNPELNIGALMGILMSKHKGKVDGKLAAQLINKYKK
ncbi:Glu-tRNA(Gln) amidotransferase GatDE subunit E [archaeon]|nr:Glu-tRNA(Gln) amidotransferase GatDE subunit E [archaeon]|tara:strand:+ start:2119 stop:3549 length:1431 start_codon:yes stop_codon:yes gene_type:complete